jgi:hypothetical protein
MECALGMISSSKRAELFPSYARQLVQKEKLIVLKLWTLPDFKQMCGYREVTLSGRLAKPHHHYNCAGAMVETVVDAGVSSSKTRKSETISLAATR